MRSQRTNGVARQSSRSAPAAAFEKVSALGSSFCDMPKTSARPSHTCTECGWRSSRWVGRCGECQTWGSVVEAADTEAEPGLLIGAGQQGGADRHRQRHAGNTCPHRRGRAGPGARRRPGAGVVVLLAGEPGVGKSTLLLEVAARWARNGHTTLYVTGEESAAQVRLRAGRTNAVADQLYLAAETDLGTVLGHIEEVRAVADGARLGPDNRHR